MGSEVRKRPRDPSQLAKLIVDIASGEIEEKATVPSGKVRSGKAGAKARSKALTPDQRKAIAKKAAAKRWKRADT
jgi:hypothetical protein